MLLALTAFLFLVVYILNAKGVSFNLNSSAGRNKYTATGTLIKSTQADCNQTYNYGLINPPDNKCTSLIIGASMAEKYLDQRVQLKGALKNGLFYVTEIKVLDGQNNEGAGGGNKTPLPDKTVRPVETDYPIPYPDIVKSTPVKTDPPRRFWFF